MNNRFVSGFKYFSNITLIIISFMMFYFDNLFWVWLIWAIYLTIFSHFCDLYLDYGFFGNNSNHLLLRKDL